MSRKWIGLAVLAVVAGGTALATASMGGDSSPRPDYATVDVDLAGGGGVAAKPQRGLPGGGGKKKKPRLVYLQSATPTTINPADPTAGGVGPYVDVKLTGCAKVVDGGVVPSRLDVYVQGSYVQTNAEYHVLIGIDEDNLDDRTPFTITSSLTCLKGVK
jgi:hypothetical protein